jgi:hypothetical protein
MTDENFRFENGKIIQNGNELTVQSQVQAGDVLGDNGVIDPSFEDYWNFISHTPNGWNSKGTSSQHTFVERSTNARVGNYSARIFHNESDIDISRSFSITSGHSITISTWVKIPSGNSTGATLILYDGSSKYYRFTGVNAGTWQTGEDVDSVLSIAATSEWQGPADSIVTLIAPTSGSIMVIIAEEGGSVVGSDQVLVGQVTAFDNDDGVEKLSNNSFADWTGVTSNAINTKWDCQSISGVGSYSYGYNEDITYIHSGNKSLILRAGSDTIAICDSIEPVDTTDGLTRDISLWGCYVPTYTDSTLLLYLINDVYGANTQYWDFVAEGWVNGTTTPPSADCIKSFVINGTLGEFTVEDITPPASNLIVPMIGTGGTGITASRVYVDDISIQPQVTNTFVPEIGLKSTTSVAKSAMTDNDILIKVNDANDRNMFQSWYSYSNDEVVIKGAAKDTTEEGATDLVLMGGTPNPTKEAVGGNIVLKAGLKNSLGSWINGADVYLVPDYANKDGTNREGRVYVSSLAGWDQPALQFWMHENGGAISAYADYSGTEQPLYLCGAPGYPGTDHDGKNIFVLSGAGDGSGSDGAIKFGRMLRSSISSWAPEEYLELNADVSESEISFKAKTRNDSDGYEISILAAPGQDSGVTNRNGGDVNLASGVKDNSGEDGQITFGYHDGSNRCQMLSMQFSDTEKGDSLSEVLIMGQIPEANQDGFDVLLAAQQGYDSGVTARNGGNLLLGAGKGINGGSDGIIGMVHQLNDSTGPLLGMGFEYASSILSIKALPQDLSGVSDYEGFDVKLIAGDADSGSLGDLDGGDLILEAGVGVNDGNDGRVIVSHRLLLKQGADVASANNLDLGYDGNVFEITGTTEIQLLSNLGWQNGSEVILLFTSTPTVKHATATSGAYITILLAGAVDFSATAGDVLKLVLCEIGGTQAWREVSRTAI